MREMIVKVNGFQREGHEPVLQYAGELIRCKDCKHWSADDNETYCEELGIFGTSPNSFCSFARKKEEPTMEEFMYGQNLGNPEDGSL